MPTPLQPLPPGLAAAGFTTASAVAAGASRRRLRHPSLSSPFVGARVDGPGPEEDDTRGRALALAPLLDRRHVFGRLTALRLLGVDLPPRFRSAHDLELIVVSASARVRRPGVQCRIVPPYGSFHTVGTLRYTTGATTFLHLAKSLTVEELVMVGDALTRRVDPLATLESLAAHVEGAPTCHGIARARAALAHVCPGTDSVPETILRRIIENAGFPRPVVNAPMLDDVGAYLGRPDLSFPELKLSIEYLGDVHRTDPRTWRIDVERHQRFREAGWTVHEATAETLRHPAALLRRLSDAGVPRRSAR
ncbi:hypothetical protein [Serinibacter arcticus]|uniref:hypothetical protein n=1 Tax=Serinibacter arcticus TaxID=1655435 RepID=UPI0011B1F4AD|nr:hypothetical protein [Serinibacter arcticus]